MSKYSINGAIFKMALDYAWSSEVTEPKNHHIVIRRCVNSGIEKEFYRVKEVISKTVGEIKFAECERPFVNEIVSGSFYRSKSIWTYGSYDSYMLRFNTQPLEFIKNEVRIDIEKKSLESVTKKAKSGKSTTRERL